MIVSPPSTAPTRSVNKRSEQPFEVSGWEWDQSAAIVRCHYRHGDDGFTESFRFPFAAGSELDESSARAVDLLAITAGVSYYKASAATTILVYGVGDDSGADLPLAWQRYVATLYDAGLREFAVVNSLPLPFVPTVTIARHRPARAPSARSSPDADPDSAAGPIVPMGGGRDSLLVAYALRSLQPTLLTVGTNRIVAAQASALGRTLIEVERTLDPRLLELNARGAYNGHIPVTAINSCAAVVAAVLLQRPQVVMSNEHSANEPTRIVDGITVNHQFSKSEEFERLLRSTIDVLGLGVDYFSALRPWGELAISRAVANHLDALPPFLSCNRAFVRDEARRSSGWCGECAKCRFVFVGLAPFTPRDRLVEMFDVDLLADQADVDALSTMLTGTERAFDCIGTENETGAALAAASDGEWSDSAPLRQLVTRLDTSPELLIDGLEPNGDGFAPSAIAAMIDAVMR